MLRTTINKAYIQRPIRPLYGMTQATPKAAFLDPDVVIPVPVFPGMAMRQTGGDTYTLCFEDAHLAAGLSALYIGGDDIDEPADSGVNALAVWVLAPDAEFEILSDAFAGDWSGALPESLVHFAGDAAADDRGKLVPDTYVNRSTLPVARLISVESASKIIVGGLLTRS